MIITNSSYDDFYYKQLVAFLTSLYTHNPSLLSTAWLVDYPEEVIKKLSNVFYYTSFVSKDIKKIDDRGIHFILLRVEMILDCFSKGENAAWIDTDVIVRGDISNFIEIEDNQFKILKRDTTSAEMSSMFNAGIMNIGCSINTEKFITDWYNKLKHNLKWGMGQVTLQQAFFEAKGVDLIPLSTKFNDLGDSLNKDMFSDSSLMWHSKLKHFNNHKFQQEYKYYLDKGLRAMKK